MWGGALTAELKSFGLRLVGIRTGIEANCLRKWKITVRVPE